MIKKKRFLPLFFFLMLAGYGFANSFAFSSPGDTNLFTGGTTDIYFGNLDAWTLGGVAGDFGFNDVRAFCIYDGNIVAVGASGGNVPIFSSADGNRWINIGATAGTEVYECVQPDTNLFDGNLFAASSVGIYAYDNTNLKLIYSGLTESVEYFDGNIWRGFSGAASAGYWNGTSWTTANPGIDEVRDFVVYDNNLYASGGGAQNYRWETKTQWVEIGTLGCGATGGNMVVCDGNLFLSCSSENIYTFDGNRSALAVSSSAAVGLSFDTASYLACLDNNVIFLSSGGNDSNVFSYGGTPDVITQIGKGSDLGSQNALYGLISVDVYQTDFTEPIIDFNIDFNNSDGFTADLNQGFVSVSCSDTNSPTVRYIVGINDVNYLDVWATTGSDQVVNFDLEITSYNIKVTCIDEAGNVDEDLNSFSFYFRQFFFINEETGGNLDFDDVNGLVGYSPDYNFFYDFKAQGDNNINFFSEEDISLRFEITYSDVVGTDVVVRNFNVGVLDLNLLRVCVPPFYPTIYTHFLLSSSARPVAVYNPHTDCYVVASYISDVYQTNFLSEAILINKAYNLYAWDGNVQIVLGSIDGTVESTINVDALEYSITEYSLDISENDIHVSLAYDNTLMFYYLNLRQNNAILGLELYDGTDLIWFYTEESSPNELTVYFDHTSLEIDNDMLRLVVTRTLTNGDVETFTKYFTLSGFSGVLPPAFALLFAFAMVIFSLTFVAYRLALGWFGIIACLIGIAVLTLAPPLWYVILAQGTLVIVILFIALIFKGETAAVS